MKKFLPVLKQLLVSYLAASLAYRASFLQSVLASLMWSTLSFFTAFLVTTQTPSVFGMDRQDLLLLAATYGIIVGIHHWLCSRGFASFSETIHKGELDGYLLRPFDTLTFLSLRNIAWPSAPRIIGSMLLTMVIVQTYGFSVSPLNVLSFGVLGVFSFLLMYSIYSIGCTILIWHSYLNNIIELVQFAVGCGRYPLAMRNHVPFTAIFLYLPFLMITNIPTQALIGRLGWGEAGVFITMSLGTFAFSRWLWRFALGHYTGASA